MQWQQAVRRWAELPIVQEQARRGREIRRRGVVRFCYGVVPKGRANGVPAWFLAIL
jgi:hypothetical protein